jgi:DNA primase
LAIPHDFIDKVVSATRLEDLVADYTTLKRVSGSRYTGLCPFHGEKTPSFGVSADKQLYYCFGCGKGGGAVNFIMTAENLSFPDAIRYLAARAGLIVPEDNESHADTQSRSVIMKLLTDAAKWFHAQLKTSEAAQSYLNHRRISMNTAVRFGLGYAPDSWDSFSNAALGMGYSRLDLLNAGLSAKSSKKSSYYDKFRQRLMFPVIDVKGQVIAFGGRILDDGEPKYLNSPEITNVFSKRRTLYGINLAKNTKYDYFILVEGNIDVITLHQAGFDNAVASMGTSLTPEQVSLISRCNIKEVVVCYDADSAGIKATDRAIAELDKAGISLSVLRVPDGKDVDDYIKSHGAAEFRRLLDNRRDDVTYRLNKLESEFDLTKDDSRADFLRAVVQLFATLDPIRREVFAPKAAKLAQVESAFISAEAAKAAKQLARAERGKEDRSALRPVQSMRESARIGGFRFSHPRSAAAEQGIIELVVNDPQILAALDFDPHSEFTSPELARILAAMLARFRAGESTDAATLTAELTREEMSLLSRLCSNAVPISNAYDVLSDCLRTIRAERAAKSGDLAALIAARSDISQ